MIGLAERLQPPEVATLPANHLGLRWRSLIARDAPAVFDLCRRAESHDHVVRPVSADDIADMVEGLCGRDAVDTIVGLDVHRKITAVASVRVIREITDRATAILTAVIDPQWRGRGIGRSVLYWQDGRARQLLVDEFGGDSAIAASIVNLVDSHMTDRRRLCIAAGFSAKRHLMLKWRELEGAENAPQLGKYSVSSPSLEQIPILKAQNHTSHISTDWLQRQHQILDGVDPQLSHILHDADGKMLGYSLVARPSTAWVLDGRPSVRLHMLATIVAISDPAQRRTTMKQLLELAIAAASSRGCDRLGVIIDSTTDLAHDTLIDQLGFIDDHAVIVYSNDL